MKIQDIIVLPVDDGIINKTVNNAIKKGSSDKCVVFLMHC